MSALRLTDVRMAYPQTDGRALQVLDGITLDVQDGEFFAIVGPSGCGKTTLLDLAIGLSHSTAGTVEAPASRTAMVFQKPHLLPWRTTLDNALYGLQCRRPILDADRERGVDLLQRMRLGAHLHEYPHALSEGMKQRVNLARALLVEPDLLLMDEPFAALDPATRQRLQDDLLALWHERGFTVVFVSHSVQEVAYLADRIAVLSDKPTRLREIVDVALPRPRGGDPETQLALLQRAAVLTQRCFG